MYQDLLYQVALTLLPHIGPVQSKILLQHFDASEIFKASRASLEKIEGIGTVRARAISSFHDFTRAEEEIAFIDKYHITPLFITDKKYPQRLLNCYDPPTLLYYKGTADLNASRIVSVIGTRTHTPYGKMVTENLIRDLAAQHVLIVSGLAHGIDAIAHKNALQNQLSTVGVLAHGLDLVYPLQHKGLAKEMTRHGGLLTEFCSRTNPDKHNFPTRNRIVAGMSDSTVVVETGIKGGSMITAELANNYNKDVFAFPGRITDLKSAGCNKLIRTNKAVLLNNAAELIELMGWEAKKTVPNRQKELFITLTPNERVIMEILNDRATMHIDEINLKSNLASSAVAEAILHMELKGLIHSLPGKTYCLAP